MWRCLSSVTCDPIGAGRSPQVIFPPCEEAALRPSTSIQTMALALLYCSTLMYYHTLRIQRAFSFIGFGFSGLYYCWYWKTMKDYNLS